MPIACPVCCNQWTDLFGLSLHLEDEHPEAYSRVVAVLPLPVIEVDIDAVHINYGTPPCQG